MKNFIQLRESLKQACWKGYEAVGTKKKNGKTVPNCVPTKEEAAALNKATAWLDNQRVSEGRLIALAGGIPSDRYGNPKERKPPKSTSVVSLKQLEKNRRTHPHQSPFVTQDQKVKKYLGMKKEEVEQIDELDKKTLQSYKAKSQNEIEDMVKDLRGKYYRNVNPEKLQKRASGIKLATAKLKKEEVEHLIERGEDSKGYKRSTESGAGLTRKGAKAMGVKTAVTTPPSKLKKGGTAWKRRKSFCARMSGMKGQ